MMGEVLRVFLILTALSNLWISSAIADMKRISTFPVGESELAIPIITEAYKRLGYDVEITTLPAKRSLISVNRGDYDAELMRIDGTSKHYPNLVKIPVSILNSKISVITKKESSFTPKDWKDLPPAKLGIPLGVQVVSKGTEGMESEKVTSSELLLNMVLKNRIEAAILPLAMAYKHPNLMAKLRIVEPAIQVVKIYHYVHKKNAHLVPDLTRILEEIVPQ